MKYLNLTICIMNAVCLAHSIQADHVVLAAISASAFTINVIVICSSLSKAEN